MVKDQEVRRYKIERKSKKGVLSQMAMESVGLHTSCCAAAHQFHSIYSAYYVVE